MATGRLTTVGIRPGQTKFPVSSTGIGGTSSAEVAVSVSVPAGPVLTGLPEVIRMHAGTTRAFPFTSAPASGVSYITLAPPPFLTASTDIAPGGGVLNINALEAGKSRIQIHASDGTDTRLYVVDVIVLGRPGKDGLIVELDGVDFSGYITGRVDAAHTIGLVGSANFRVRADTMDAAMRARLAPGKEVIIKDRSNDQVVFGGQVRRPVWEAVPGGLRQACRIDARGWEARLHAVKLTGPEGVAVAEADDASGQAQELMRGIILGEGFTLQIPLPLGAKSEHDFRYDSIWNGLQAIAETANALLYVTPTKDVFMVPLAGLGQSPMIADMDNSLYRLSLRRETRRVRTRQTVRSALQTYARAVIADGVSDSYPIHPERQEVSYLLPSASIYADGDPEDTGLRSRMTGRIATVTGTAISFAVNAPAYLGASKYEATDWSLSGDSATGVFLRPSGGRVEAGAVERYALVFHQSDSDKLVLGASADPAYSTAGGWVREAESDVSLPGVGFNLDAVALGTVGGVDYAFLAEQSDNIRVFRLDTGAREATRDIPLSGGGWDGLAISGNDGWAVSSTGNRFYKVDLTAKTRSSSISLPTSGASAGANYSAVFVLGSHVHFFDRKNLRTAAYTFANARATTEDITFTLGTGESYDFRGASVVGDNIALTDVQQPQAVVFTVSGARLPDLDLPLPDGYYSGASPFDGKVWFLDRPSSRSGLTPRLVVYSYAVPQIGFPWRTTEFDRVKTGTWSILLVDTQAHGVDAAGVRYLGRGEVDVVTCSVAPDDDNWSFSSATQRIVHDPNEDLPPADSRITLAYQGYEIARTPAVAAPIDRIDSSRLAPSAIQDEADNLLDLLEDPVDVLQGEPLPGGPYHLSTGETTTLTDDTAASVDASTGVTWVLTQVRISSGARTGNAINYAFRAHARRFVLGAPAYWKRLSEILR